MNEILITTTVVTVLGLVCAVLLAVIANKFGEKEDPRITQVTLALPGANCGGCGYAGCTAYAQAIVLNDAPLNKCIPGGPNVVAALSSATGRAGGELVPMMAFVLCGGDRTAAKPRSEYNGITDCSAANNVAGGWKQCIYGCLGFGSCARTCEFGAISIVNGLAVVNPNICTGCGACVSACPRNLIKVVPVAHKIHVRCSSPEKGIVVRKICTNGCIGCGMCVKMEGGASMTMVGTLAKVDYAQAPVANEGVVAKCPSKCIVKIG